MYPNPDYDSKKMQNVKSYSDYQLALKKGICPEVHELHVISYVETRDLALLPKNMNWCFPELNFYAQCNRLSLAFETSTPRMLPALLSI
eukprot:2033706-Amphidinium_carterae.1